MPHAMERVMRFLVLCAVALLAACNNDLAGRGSSDGLGGTGESGNSAGGSTTGTATGATTGSTTGGTGTTTGSTTGTPTGGTTGSTTGGTGTPPKTFRAAAAKATLAVPGAVCTGGYGIFCNRRAGTPRTNSKGVLDTLETRALAIEDHTGKKLVMVTTSVIGLFAAYKAPTGAADAAERPGLYQARLAIARAANMPIENIFIQSDHSHFSPDSVGIWGGASEGEPFNELLQAYAASMAAAVTEAVAHLEPASLRYGAVDADVVACPSMVPRCLSDSLYSSDPNRFTDEKFRLIEARRADGSRIFSWVNYAPHATVLDDFGDDVALSGDWASWIVDDLDQSGDCGSTRCALGLATLATLGRTDYNNTDAGRPDGANGVQRNLARERNARARLEYFLDLLRTGSTETGVTPFATLAGDSAITVRERLISEAVSQGIFYANHGPFVGLPQALGSGVPFASDFTSNSTASIERANTPPWLNGNVISTLVSAFRIGPLFFGTAPGEQFPNAMQRIREEGGVQGPAMHFYLGVTNDFVGYMAPTASYDQVAAQGAFYLAGCPEDRSADQFRDLLAFLETIGYDSERLFDDGSCPDHFVLMASPTLGDHVTCSVQAMAGEIGFTVGLQESNCPALTASDRPGGELPLAE